jgi:myo-inositol catabolism protein IolC
MDQREDCENVVAAARVGSRGNVNCIILGRGEDERKVRQWLGVAADVPGFLGFAVDRTVFWDPLIASQSKKATLQEMVAEIAKRNYEFVDLFERASIALPS